jgi:hypothetical protein
METDTEDSAPLVEMTEPPLVKKIDDDKNVKEANPTNAKTSASQNNVPEIVTDKDETDATLERTNPLPVPVMESDADEPMVIERLPGAALKSSSWFASFQADKTEMAKDDSVVAPLVVVIRSVEEVMDGLVCTVPSITIVMPWGPTNRISAKLSAIVTVIGDPPELVMVTVSPAAHPEAPGMVTDDDTEH